MFYFIHIFKLFSSSVVLEKKLINKTKQKKNLPKCFLYSTVALLVHQSCICSYMEYLCSFFFVSWHLFSLYLDSVDGAVGILVHIWLFPVIVLISILSPRRWPYPGRGCKRFTRHWHEERVFVNGHWKNKLPKIPPLTTDSKINNKNKFFKALGIKRHHGSVTYSKLYVKDNLDLSREETFRCFCGWKDYSIIWSSGWTLEKKKKSYRNPCQSTKSWLVLFQMNSLLVTMET